MYKAIIRPLFFCFDPEKIHDFVFKSLKVLNAIPGFSSLSRALYKVNDPRLKRTVFG
jgi:dihydroorotate dehydrogenase